MEEAERRALQAIAEVRMTAAVWEFGPHALSHPLLTDYNRQKPDGAGDPGAGL